MTLYIPRYLHLVLLAGALLLSACQTTRGSWYFQKEPGTAPLPRECDGQLRTCLYLSVINDTRKVLHVDEVRVYSSPPPALPFADDRAAFWNCKYQHGEQGYELAPGRLIILTLPHDGAAACMIPMDANLLVNGRRNAVGVRIESNLPDSIPNVWLACPASQRTDPATSRSVLRCGDKRMETLQDGFEAKECMPMPFHCDLAGSLQPALP